ncbi:MAG: hypothetical protein LN413_00280 [Candidatus Thermoplasmatota archaeon]|nr:hypothetical protein [Candidatus Thermoplasmatota archaeon]
MAQYALPDADLDHVDWTEGAGDANGTHWEELDEGFGSGRGSGFGPDDATTYWRTGNNPNGIFITSKLGTVTDPAVSTGHIWRTRNRKNSAGGTKLDIDIRILQGGIQRGFASFLDMSDTWTTRSDPMTGAEADTITDYSDLEIRTAATKDGGGQGRHAQESAHEFECPDAAAAERVVGNMKLIPKIHHRPRARDARW